LDWEVRFLSGGGQRTAGIVFARARNFPGSDIKKKTTGVGGKQKRKKGNCNAVCLLLGNRQQPRLCGIGCQKNKTRQTEPSFLDVTGRRQGRHEGLGRRKGHSAPC